MIFETLMLLTEQFFLPKSKQIANINVIATAAVRRVIGIIQVLNSRYQANAVITANGTAFARL